MKHAKREQPVSSKALRASTIDGIFAVGSDNIVAPYTGLFALKMGATEGQIGLLTALPALLGNIMQMPYALLTDRVGRRKLICIVGGLFGRGAWLLAAFIPFALWGEYGIWAYIALVALRGLIITLGAPGWTSLMADIIPRRIRGRYFATRNVYCNISAFLFTLLAGLLVREYGFPFGYQLVFATAAVLGMISIVYFVTIPDPREQTATKNSCVMQHHALPSAESEGKVSISELWSSNANFRSYTWTSLFWNLAVSLPAPVFVVYFVDTLGGRADTWSIVSAAALLAHIVGQRYWGRRADRFGNKPVMHFSGFGAAALPFFWLIMPDPFWAIVLNFTGGFAWAGYNLAAFNLILELTPDKHRTSYVGLYNTVAGVASSIGPLIGGFAAEWIGIRPLFGISTVLRFAALFLFLRMVNVGREEMTLGHLLPEVRHTHRPRVEEQAPVVVRKQS